MIRVMRTTGNVQCNQNSQYNHYNQYNQYIQYRHIEICIFIVAGHSSRQLRRKSLVLGTLRFAQHRGILHDWRVQVKLAGSLYASISDLSRVPLFRSHFSWKFTVFLFSVLMAAFTPSVPWQNILNTGCIIFKQLTLSLSTCHRKRKADRPRLQRKIKKSNKFCMYWLFKTFNPSNQTSGLVTLMPLFRSYSIICFDLSFILP